MRKHFIICILLSCLYVATRGQTMPNIDLSGLPQPTQAKALRYWFDEDASSVKTITQLSGKQTLDVSSLCVGLHTVHYQMIDSKDIAGAISSSIFVKVDAAASTTATSMRYWFDDDGNGVKTVSSTSGIYTLDISTLVEGLHTIHYQLIASDGKPSFITSAIFIKTGSATATTVSKLVYWFDDSESRKQVNLSAGVLTLDASALPTGLHTLHCQWLCSDGSLAPVMSAIFIRIDTDSEAAQAKTIRYWFDDQATAVESKAVQGTHIVDASKLIEGLHSVHYQIIDSKGHVGSPVSALFMKLDEKSLAQAQTIRYWFDENDKDAIQSDVSELVRIVDASNLKEGPHALHYQLLSADGRVFPSSSAAFDRCYFDIYIKQLTQYNNDVVTTEPVFSTTPFMKLQYSPDDVAIRGQLTVESDAQLSLGKYLQTGNLGYYNDNYKFTSTGNAYYHPTTLVNQGFMRSDSVIVQENIYHNRWHFFSLPFNVNVSDIDMPEDTYWALRKYDGEARAAGNMYDTWQNLHKDDMMEGGRGYILQLTREGEDNSTLLTFKSPNDTKKNNIFASTDVDVPLNEYQSEFAHNRSWNLIGNPYPCFYDSRYMNQNGSIIVWNGNGYSSYSLQDDNYVLMPFEAFFIQRAVDSEALTFNASGRQHTSEPQAVAPARVKSANANVERRILNFILSDGQQSDRSRIVLNEQAYMGYETDKDAPKFMESKPAMPQLYSVEAGVKYSINERPLGKGFATLSVYVPETGEYVLRVDGYEGVMDNLTIYDSETNETWPVVRGDYTFTAEAGYYDGRFVVAFLGDATAISQPNITEDGEISVLNGQLSFSFAKAKHISVYSIDGIRLYSNYAANGEAMLASGVYVVDIDGKRTKIIIK